MHAYGFLDFIFFTFLMASHPPGVVTFIHTNYMAVWLVMHEIKFYNLTLVFQRYRGDHGVMWRQQVV